MVFIMRQSNTLQFQYFLDFIKCLQLIFSKLSFGNLWVHLLVEVAMTQNLLKITEKYFKLPRS